MKKIVNLLRSILSGVLMAALVLVLAAVVQQKIMGRVPGIFGYHLMYVLTGSMSPELEAGDAVLVHSCDGSSVLQGDVICYYGQEGDMAGRLITHKVIEAPHEEDGRIVLLTKGTANAVADPPIAADQVFGKVVCRLRLIGSVYRFFCTLPGFLLMISPIVLQLVLEVRRMVLLVREDIREAVEDVKQEEQE